MSLRQRRGASVTGAGNPAGIGGLRPRNDGLWHRGCAMMLAITVAAVIVLAAIRCAIVVCMRGLLLGRFRCRHGIMAITHCHAMVRSHAVIAVRLTLHGSTGHGISRSIEDQADAQQQS